MFSSTTEMEWSRRFRLDRFSFHNYYFQVRYMSLDGKDEEACFVQSFAEFF